MSTIQLVQPRHSYAASEGEGHVHLAAPLMTVAARIIEASKGDVNIIYTDENFAGSSEVADPDIIGINLVGAPYIPEVIKMLKDMVREDTKIILGGQIISSLSEDEFDRLFRPNGENVFNGNDDTVLAELLGIDENSLPSSEKVSLVPAFEQIPDEQMRGYLSREISLYLSQGCRYRCNFCQADNGKPEQYRDLSAAKEDLKYLVLKAKEFGIDHFDIYLSNLDLFQTPEKLLEFAEVVIEIKNRHNFEFNFRGLSTVSSFLRAHKKYPETIVKIKEAGLTTVGYGVDGTTAKIWEGIGKCHNIAAEGSEEQKCIDAIATTREAYDLTPEVLMVFGHLGEDEDTLRAALQFVEDMTEKYGAVPRPHVAKSIIPGTTAWLADENQDIVEAFLRNPELFQALDYTALPSSITHRDPELRALVEKYYLKICAITGNSTLAIYPNTPEFQQRAAAQGTTVEKMNEGTYDR